MGYADSVRTGDYVSREQLATLIEGIFSSSYEDLWQSWTPTWGAVGSMTFSAVTTNRARYIQVGNLVIFQVSGTGTIGGTVNIATTFTLPVTSSTSSALFSIGSGYIDDSATPSIQAYGYLGSTTTGRIAFYDVRNYTAGSATATVSGFYEAA